MFRLLPWSSVVGGPSKEVTTGDVKVLPGPQRKDSQVMEHAAIHKLKKRKRSDSQESLTTLSAEQHQGLSSASPTERKHGNSKQSHGNTTNRNNNNDGQSNSISVTSSAGVSTEATSPGSISNPPLPLSMDDSEDKVAARAKALRKMDPDTLRQTLDSQLSLEILLKHDELRLIDQEIAKCQVSLEQLRRCAEIPFPASSSSATQPSASVSSGTGPSVAPQTRGGRLPPSPAPWGVTDGPYSRHYSKWLLPDARFDGGEPEPVAPAAPVGAGKSTQEGQGRTTRASWADTGVVPPPPARTQRTNSAGKLQALSTGYPPPKDKAGPMIIKRKSDGQLVKLVCIDCRRDNFSSTQGFINHCRIAHNRSFASHDAAAVASGEPVEVDESGAVVGGKETESATTGPPGYVHPLIRSAHLVDPNAKASSKNKHALQRSAPKGQNNTQQQQQSTGTPTRTSTTGNVPSRRSGSRGDTTDAFKGSPQTPHLSALMQRQGLGLDLLGIVDDALTKTDMGAVSSDGEEEDDTGDEAEPEPKKGGSPLDARSGRLPTRTVISPSHPQRPGSQKGADKGGRKPFPSGSLKPPSTTTTTAETYQSPYHLQPPSSPKFANTNPNADLDMVDATAPELSPNTLESNQAPSLVSDNGEYEARSDSESPSPSSSESNADEAAFDNVEVQDADENESNESTTTGSVADPDIAAPGKRRTAATPMSRAPVVKKQKRQAKSKGAAARSTPAPAAPEPEPESAPEPSGDVKPKRVGFAAGSGTKKGKTKRQRRK